MSFLYVIISFLSIQLFMHTGKVELAAQLNHSLPVDVVVVDVRLTQF